MKGKIYFILLIILVGAIYHNNSPEKIIFEVNKIYSRSIASRLDNFFAGEVDTLEECCTKLKDQFDIVKKVEWDLTDPSVKKVRITGVEPQWKVNKDFILAENKCMYPLEVFSDFKGLLEEIKISEKYCDKKMDDSVYKFLQKVPCEFSSRYTINYKNDRHIILEPKDLQKKYMVLVDEESFFDNKKLECINSIEGGGQVFDLRFRGRIITRSRKRV